MSEVPLSSGDSDLELGDGMGKPENFFFFSITLKPRVE